MIAIGRPPQSAPPHCRVAIGVTARHKFAALLLPLHAPDRATAKAAENPGPGRDLLLHLQRIRSKFPRFALEILGFSVFRATNQQRKSSKRAATSRSARESRIDQDDTIEIARFLLPEQRHNRAARADRQ